ncbi:NTP transferase domain-containing protein [Haloechinothrix sp. YIM 98757]|uniref:Probable molybdenum cofactor guanylyltransferase n=1 Tax=Haloechinothrix aidingensis TaxID=2752311 RepID=A0A838A716_9PSEU|nr:NTP transferase domain-containing protein [Haloechinothrix aidingensis]MBA0124815.1 NTP transferase domain-containing protein [Haloechinothrix aidingensis]
MNGAAGIVLAGGRSSRMGTSKAALEWHGSTLLRQVTGVLDRAVTGPVIVVRAPDQKLPELDPRVVVREDPEEGHGPMQGLAVGLDAAHTYAETAFVCSTDLPFLHAAFVHTVLRGFQLDREHGEEAPIDVVLPLVHGYRQPMAAGYRTGLAPLVAQQLRAGQHKPAQLFEHCRVRRLTDEELLADPNLARADPGLESVVNVNTPEDYERARARQAPEVTVERFGVLATRGGTRGSVRARAATLAEAAEQVGLTLDGHIVAAVNGDQIRDDGQCPLLSGDTVSFLSADAGG